MKPISEMSPAEVNREIAERLGWVRRKDPTSYSPHRPYWFTPDGRRKDGYPDYCGSWDAAGRLFEEMIAAGLKPLLWWYGGCSTANIAVAYGATCPEAIARCWLAWRRSQDETTH